ncbi:hypothetical protein ACFQ1S_24090 [Kibdelosporangium lantanae]|uniref:Uncharacterized protein n=1 Tax=Kibdelosporangium lantanae TaxID=1497396 RepID=A0ABW3MCA4_9PSEU
MNAGNRPNKGHWSTYPRFCHVPLADSNRVHCHHASTHAPSRLTTQVATISHLRVVARSPRTH